MAITAVTVTGTATFAGGGAVPNAIVSFVPDETSTNSGTSVAAAVGAFGNVNGAWTITVNATEDAATVPLTGAYLIRVTDPITGEHLDDFRAAVPHASTTTTIGVLRGTAF